MAGDQKETMPRNRLPRAGHSAGAPKGFPLPTLTSPQKGAQVWRWHSSGTEEQSPRGNCGLTKKRPFDQMIKSLSYANAWTGWTSGQFSGSKLQLIFEEIACSRAFAQLCHTRSHTAAFVTARAIWNMWQGRPFWGKMLKNIDIHTHTHYKYTHTWAGT